MKLLKNFKGIYIMSDKEFYEMKSQIKQEEMLAKLREPKIVIKSIDELEAILENGFDQKKGKGLAFEYLCADILKKNNFENVKVTPESGDHGIDILAEKYGITYAIQCKSYSSNVGNAAIQQAHTGKSIYHKDIAVVLTNRYFTPQAKKEAKTLSVKLWDRDKLSSMIEHPNN